MTGAPMDRTRTPEVVIRTSAGRVRGLRVDGVDLFRGVRYGTARRYEAPRPVDSWDGIADALLSAPVCPQMPGLPVGALNRIIGWDLNRIIGWDLETDQSEDCLSLNVWSPDVGGARPIVVVLHPGAFTYGSGNLTMLDGSALARQGDVVVVAPNYRLGIFGFGPVGDWIGEGFAENAGLLDQILALQWVRDNAERIGGDPSNVTLVGMSAGGTSVLSLLTASPATGLFHRAACISGPFLRRTVDAAREHLERFLSEVAAGEVGRSLLAGPADRLIGGGYDWGPVLHGELLPKHLLTALDDGDVAPVPLLIGTTQHESTLFSLGDLIKPLDHADVASTLSAGPFWPDLREVAPAIVDSYRRLDPDASAHEIMTRIQSHYPFRAEVAHLCNRWEAQTGAPAFQYLFTREPTGRAQIFRAGHLVDVPYWFGTTEKVPLVGTTPDPELATTMVDYLASFAATGTPTSSTGPSWLPWSPARRNVLVLGDGADLVEDPYGLEAEIWEPYRDLDPAEVVGKGV